jgi:deoxycytidylate deaminase
MLQVAFVVSGWSPEPEGQRHGCVLAVDGKYIVATGFNGPDRFHKWPKDGSPRVVHAEENAMLNLRLAGDIPLDRCVAFVTKKPCDHCMELLRRGGVLSIFWLQDVGEDRGQWTR